jgi:hypothetical protein
MYKLTPEALTDILNRPVTQSSEEELKATFDVLGFKLKEFYTRTEGNKVVSMSFEVHFKRTFVIEVESESGSKLHTFSNEYVNFGDGTSGLSMALDNVKNVIQVVINIFCSRMRVPYDGTITWRERTGYTEKEYIELGHTLNKVIFDKNEPMVVWEPQESDDDDEYEDHE